MTMLRARIVAQPAAVSPGEHGRVLGASPAAVYVQVGVRVVAMTARSVPPMPNGFSLDASQLPAISPGQEVDFAAGEIRLGETVVLLEGAKVWSPAAPDNSGRSSNDVGRRGRGVLRNCRVSPASDPERMAESLAASGLGSAQDAEGRKGTAALLLALATRDSEAAAEAGSLLLGRGSGLTPEGDDLVGGALAAIAAFGSPAGVGSKTATELREALIPADLRERTTMLSATLLDLAAGGMVVEPMLPVLDLEQPPDRWRPALRSLLSIGHTTGRAWALGCAAGAAMLGGKETSR